MNEMNKLIMEILSNSSLIDVKCTNCHHEAQATQEGAQCEWCNNGTLEKLNNMLR